MLNLVPPKNQNLPIETDLGKEVRDKLLQPIPDEIIKVDYSQVEIRVTERPWNSYKLVPGELAYDWRNKRLVRLSTELPVEVLRESSNHILWPNWEWQVTDVINGKQYKRIEYQLIGTSEILSWGVSKRKRLSMEYGWAGNRMVVAQPLSEILEYFQNELGDKYVEFKAPAKS